MRAWNQGQPILYLDHQDLQRWQTERAAVVKPQTLRSEMSAVRSFFRWAVREELLDVDPTARLDMPKVGRRLPRPITQQKYAMALERADLDMRVILGLAGWAGLRACEIARLDWRDVDLEERSLRVVGKGDKEAVVPMPVVLAELLRELPYRRGPVVRRRDGRDDHNLPHTISHRAGIYLHSIGLTESLHQLRHMFGTQILRATKDLRVAQEALRHASPATTAIYTLVNVDDVRSAVDLAAGG